MEFSDWPNELLDSSIITQSEDIEDTKAKLAKMEQRLAAAIKEQEARRITAYFAAHPDYASLKIGDVLAITEEFLALRDMRWYWKNIRRAIVTGFDFDNETILIKDHGVPATVGVGNIPIAIASNMRKAYIDKFTHA